MGLVQHRTKPINSLVMMTLLQAAIDTNEPLVRFRCPVCGKRQDHIVQPGTSETFAFCCVCACMSAVQGKWSNLYWRVVKAGARW